MKRCIIKEFWDVWTPYIQITGYAVLAGGLAFAAYATTDTVSGFDQRLKYNEKKVERIEVVEQKLDLAIQLLRRR